jgi:hypothetical protein
MAASALSGESMSVTLPNEVGEVVYLDQDGKEVVTFGSRKDIALKLRQAGYAI